MPRVNAPLPDKTPPHGAENSPSASPNSGSSSGSAHTKAGSYAQHWLLGTLERLLAIDALDVRTALGEASDLITRAVEADKVDIFLFDPSTTSLVAMGVSHTPLSKKQLELGLDRLALANGGRSANVFTSRQPYITGRADLDPEELPGVKNALQIRSIIAVPMYLAGELRGVIQVDSLRPDLFSDYDLRFMEAVAGWVGTITHRSDLIAQIRRDVQEEAKRTTAEELIATIAHDLGNFLTPIKGRIGLMRHNARKKGNEAFVRDADALNVAVNRLSQMVQNLMDVSRLEQGILQLQKTRASLVDLVQSTAGSLTSPSCPISVKSYTDIYADVDVNRLRQALENLLANALKHSTEGATVYVELATEKQEEGDWAVISVTDQGPGINPDLLPRLFKKFTPGPGSTGLGIGLYLAQGIAHAHGGTLIAESQPGAGATFRFRLPLALNPTNAAET